MQVMPLELQLFRNSEIDVRQIKIVLEKHK